MSNFEMENKEFYKIIHSILKIINSRMPDGIEFTDDETDTFLSSNFDNYVHSPSSCDFEQFESQITKCTYIRYFNKCILFLFENKLITSDLCNDNLKLTIKGLNQYTRYELLYTPSVLIKQKNC